MINIESIDSLDSPEFENIQSKMIKSLSLENPNLESTQLKINPKIMTAPSLTEPSVDDAPIHQIAASEVIQKAPQQLPLSVEETKNIET